MRAAVGIFALVILVALVPVALSASLDESATTVQVTNETFTPASAGDVATLGNSSRDDVLYNQTVTVYNSSDVQMSAGTDYQWLTSNGTVKTLAGGDLVGEPSANITYGYLDSTERRLRANAIAAQLPSMLGMALPLLAVLLFIRVLVG